MDIWHRSDWRIGLDRRRWPLWLVLEWCFRWKCETIELLFYFQRKKDLIQFSWSGWMARMNFKMILFALNYHKTIKAGGQRSATSVLIPSTLSVHIYCHHHFRSIASLAKLFRIALRASIDPLSSARSATIIECGYLLEHKNRLCDWKLEIDIWTLPLYARVRCCRKRWKEFRLGAKQSKT